MKRSKHGRRKANPTAPVITSVCDLERSWTPEPGFVELRDERGNFYGYWHPVRFELVSKVMGRRKTRKVFSLRSARGL